MVSECRDILGDKELVSKLLNSNFALLVVDNDQKCPFVQYLRNKSGVPIASVSALPYLASANLFSIRSPFNPSYMPEHASGLDHDMSFYERLRNVATSITYCFLFTLQYNVYYQVRVDFGIPETTPYYSDADII